MKYLVLLAFVFLLTASAMAQSMNNYYLLVGTYTNEGKTNGIHVISFDAATGAWEEKSKYTSIVNPSFLAVTENGKNVYAVSEAGEGNGVNAFAFDASSGRLTHLNSGTSGGSGPCYIAVDNARKTVFVGNYGGGSLSATRLNRDGSLDADVQIIQHEGSSVNPRRQGEPHVHATVLSPDEKYLLVPDLGTDRVNVYRYAPNGDRPLSPASPAFASVKPGGGPRHLAFHPNGKFAYLVLEMEGAVVVFDYKDGTLTSRQRITMLAEGFDGSVGAADIHVSPDGKFLYASNRGDANEIVIYSVAGDGTLTYAGRQGAGIDTPRNFAIDPTGKLVFVANQDGNNIAVFRRDATSGALSPTDIKILVDKPVCIKFVPRP